MVSHPQVPSLHHLIKLDERLRMVPTDPEAMCDAVETLRSRLNGAQDAGEHEVVMLRNLGCGLIALGRYDEAREVLERAVMLTVANADVRAEIAGRINLGDALRYAGETNTAEIQYSLALQKARRSAPHLVDFALQHQGKHFVDVGRLEDAVACLREAMVLRQAKGDQNLIASTQSALNLARRSRTLHGYSTHSDRRLPSSGADPVPEHP